MDYSISLGRLYMDRGSIYIWAFLARLAEEVMGPCYKLNLYLATNNNSIIPSSCSGPLRRSELAHDIYLMFFSNHSSHCSPVKPLDMLPSSIPYHKYQPYQIKGDKQTDVEQHGRSHMYAHPSVRLQSHQPNALSAITDFLTLTINLTSSVT